MTTRAQLDRDDRPMPIKLGGKMVRLYVMVSIAIAYSPECLAADDPAPSKTVLPRIEMQDVPLIDAIKNLARQAGINYILDPRVLSFLTTSDGRPAPQRTVSVLWTNVSASEGLSRVLKQNRLAPIPNPATFISRIVFTNQVVQPASLPTWLAASNEVLPLIVIDDVPLIHVIQNVARQAKLNVTVDPKLPVSSADHDGWTISDCHVSVRWENVTATQALVAVLDNYNLLLVQELATSSARIVPKTHARAGPGSAPNEK
jgi:hypothetical protein